VRQTSTSSALHFESTLHRYSSLLLRDSMESMFETFDHTADLGLRIRAGDLNSLFAEAALALTSILVEDPTSVQPARRVEIDLPADAVEFQMFDWLNSILGMFEHDRLLVAKCEVQISPIGVLTAAVECEEFDPSRHELSHEVKAITYHDLRVEETNDGWLAEVIVDI
jgi:SHS2 domain-containing protein